MMAYNNELELDITPTNSKTFIKAVKRPALKTPFEQYQSDFDINTISNMYLLYFFRTLYPEGAILRVRMCHFVTYELTDIYPGPLMNLVHDCFFRLSDQMVQVKVL